VRSLEARLGDGQPPDVGGAVIRDADPLSATARWQQDKGRGDAVAQGQRSLGGVARTATVTATSGRAERRGGDRQRAPPAPTRDRQRRDSGRGARANQDTCRRPGLRTRQPRKRAATQGGDAAPSAAAALSGATGEPATADPATPASPRRLRTGERPQRSHEHGARARSELCRCAAPGRGPRAPARARAAGNA
jgi:hypothetical protein